MGKIVITTNVTLDGVVQDPDGQEGSGLGSWFTEFGGKDLEEWTRLETEEALATQAAGCWPTRRCRPVRGTCHLLDGSYHSFAATCHSFPGREPGYSGHFSGLRNEKWPRRMISGRSRPGA